MEIITYLLSGGALVIIAGLATHIYNLSKEILLKDVQIKTGNAKIDAIVNASREEAIATDYYVRSMADGTLTIEEGAQFKNYAANAIISHLTLLETLTGRQIYNRTVVPLPLPVGGKRPENTSEQPVQTVNQEGGNENVQ